MNTLKYLLLPLLLAFSLFSCDNDDVKGDPELPPDKSKAILSLDVKLDWSGELAITDTNTKEKIVDINVSMDNMSQLIFLAHSSKNEEIVVAKVISDIASLKTADGDYVWKDIELPFGKYYITVIAVQGEILQEENILPLTDPYSRAVCRMPESIVFYRTTEMYLEQDNPGQKEKEIKASVLLNLITKGYFAYEILDWDKVPAGAEIVAKSEIRNVASAFFLKNGATLSSADHIKYGIDQYTDKKSVTKPMDSKLFAFYPLLSNEQLDDNPQERGVFKFTFTENKVEKVTNEIVLKKHDSSEGWSGEVHAGVLYPEKPAEE